MDRNEQPKRITDLLPLQKYTTGHLLGEVLKDDKGHLILVDDLEKLFQAVAQPKVLTYVVKQYMFGGANAVNFEKIKELAGI